VGVATEAEDMEDGAGEVMGEEAEVCLKNAITLIFKCRLINF